MSYRIVMTGLILGAGVLAAIGGVSLLSDDRVALGITILVTAAVVCGTGVATWRWSGELTR